MDELSRMEVGQGVGQLIEDVVLVDGFQKGVFEGNTEVGFHKFQFEIYLLLS